MNILILYAHHEASSFNGALLNVAKKTLAQIGHTVVISDLYEENFQAAGDKRDFTQIDESVPFHYRKEQQRAYKNATFAPEIQREQKRVTWSDALVIQCPMWCFSVPAIVKGWFDRVLTKDFAYGKDMEYTTGGMGKRQALLSLTTAGPKSIYEEGGLHGPIGNYLFHITNGMLPYVGFDVLDPSIFYAVENATDVERKRYLLQYAEILNKHFPLQVYRCADVASNM